MPRGRPASRECFLSTIWPYGSRGGRRGEFFFRPAGAFRRRGPPLVRGPTSFPRAGRGLGRPPPPHRPPWATARAAQDRDASLHDCMTPGADEPAVTIPPPPTHRVERAGRNHHVDAGPRGLNQGCPLLENNHPVLPGPAWGGGGLAGAGRSSSHHRELQQCPALLPEQNTASALSCPAEGLGGGLGSLERG